MSNGLVIKSKDANRTEILFTILRTIKLINNWNVDKKDLKVLAALYNKYIELSEIVKEEKSLLLLLFSKDVKKEIYKDLAISYASFNNSLSALRKTGLISSSDNSLKLKHLTKLNIGKDFTLKIKFNNE